MPPVTPLCFPTELLKDGTTACCASAARGVEGARPGLAQRRAPRRVAAPRRRRLGVYGGCGVTGLP